MDAAVAVETDDTRPNAVGAKNAEGVGLPADSAEETELVEPASKKHARKTKKVRRASVPLETCAKSAKDLQSPSTSPSVSSVSTPWTLPILQSARTPPTLGSDANHRLEALRVEQLATVRLVLEAHNSSFLDVVSKQLKSFQQEAHRAVGIEVVRLQTESDRLGQQVYDTSVNPLLGALQESSAVAVQKLAREATPVVTPRKYDVPSPGTKVKKEEAVLRSEPTEAHPVHITSANDNWRTNADDQPLNNPDGKRIRSSKVLPTMMKTKSGRVTRMFQSMGSVVSGQRNPDDKEADILAVASIEKKVADTWQPSTKGPRQVFPDADAIKTQMRQKILEMDSVNDDYYKKEGLAQEIARSNVFEHFTLGVIAFNALWISVEVDNNDAPSLAQAHPVFQVVENLFCTYFVFELVVRFAAFAKKIDVRKDAWFVFDSALVLLMVSETWVMFIINLTVPSTLPEESTESGGGVGDTAVLKMVRLVRLARAARIVRLLRGCPELLVLLKGIFIAVRSVFFTMILMILLAYMFAIAFAQLTRGSEVGDDYFSTVPDAMKHLLIAACFPDLEDFIDGVGDEGWALGLLFLLFVLLVSMTILNMLVGVLVEVVGVVASVEKEELMVTFVKEELQKLLETADDTHNNKLSLKEFRWLLLQKEAIAFLRYVGVDVVALVEYVDVIFKGGKEFAFADVVNLIMELRGSNTCTVKDVIDLRKWIDLEVVEEMKSLQRSLAEVVEASAASHDHIMSVPT